MNSTNSSNSDSGLNSPEFKFFITFAYILIFATSTFGNGFVCFVLLYRQKLHKVMSYFQLNLALADSTLTVICIPFDLYVEKKSGKWPYSPGFCKLLYPLQTMTLYASVFTLCAISLSRYRAVVFPMRKQLTLFTTKRLLILIWAASLILVVPYMAVLKVDKEQQCVENWSVSSHRQFYTLFIGITMYFAPLSVITWAYYQIWAVLRTKNNAEQGQPDHAKENAKIIKMTVCISATFAVCMLPNQVIYILLDFSYDGQHIIHNEWISIGNMHVFLHCALDPVFYMIFNNKYRRVFRSILERRSTMRKIDSEYYKTMLEHRYTKIMQGLPAIKYYYRYLN